MVVPLGPAKFYGSSLPRPRFYSDVTFNSERVDPPVSVMDPFLSWASEAHWSMGGLNTEHLRFQGRIEGNVDRLRRYREKQAKLQTPKKQVEEDGDSEGKKRAGSISPPPAPRVTKKRKFMDLFDDEEEQVGESKNEGRKLLVRKLAGEFDKVAMVTDVKKKMAESAFVGVRTRRNGMAIADSVKKGSEVKKSKELRKTGDDSRVSVRTSPRLAKH